jgi:hypothetical protein
MSDERDSVCVDAFTVGSGASFQSKDFDFVDAFLFVDTDDDGCAAVFFDFSGSSDQSSSLNALAFFDLCGDCFDVDGGASDQSSSLNLDAFADGFFLVSVARSRFLCSTCLLASFDVTCSEDIKSSMSTFSSSCLPVFADRLGYACVPSVAG